MDNVNVKLRSISNEIELALIKEILSDNDIPYIVKEYGAGGHMRIISGGSLFSGDIMVSKSDLDKSNYLLESLNIKWFKAEMQFNKEK